MGRISLAMLQVLMLLLLGWKKFSGYLRFGGHGGHWENEEIVGHKVDTFNKEDLKTLKRQLFGKFNFLKLK